MMWVEDHGMLGRRGYIEYIGYIGYIGLSVCVGGGRHREYLLRWLESAGFAFKLQCATNHRRVFMLGAPALGPRRLRLCHIQISQNLPILLTDPDLPPVAVSFNLYIFLSKKIPFRYLFFPAKNLPAELFLTFEIRSLVKL